jgi:tetratricopeptide (TPR) repeat protein
MEPVLDTLLRRLLAGEIVLSTACSMFDDARLTFASDDERGRFADTLTRLFREFDSDRNIERVYDAAELLTHAAALLGDRSKADVLVMSGVQLYNRGAFRNAAEALDRAARFYHRTFRYERAVTVATNAAIAFTAAFDPASGLSTLELVEDDALANSAAPARASYLLRRSQCELRVGRAGPAFEHARDALAARALQERLPMAAEDATDEERFHYHLGLAARADARYEAAIEAFEQARSCAGRAGDRVRGAIALSESAFTWSLAGDTDRGLELQLAAADEIEPFEAITAARWRASTTAVPIESFEELALVDRASIAAGRVHQGTIDLGEAQRILLACLAQAKAQNYPELEANIRGQLAIAYAMDERWLLAEMAGEVAIELAARMGDRGLMMKLARSLGAVYFIHGNTADGERTLIRAMQTGETLRDGSSSAEVSQTIAVELARIYEQLVRLYSIIQSGENGISDAHHAKVFALAQRMRAVNLATWLALDNAVRERGGTDEIATLRALRGREIELEAGAQSSLARMGPLVAAADAAQRKFEQTAKIDVKEVRRNVYSADVSQIVGSIPPGTLYMDLVSLSEAVVATLVDASGIRSQLAIIWSREHRIAQLTVLQQGMAARRSSDVRSGTRAWRSIDDGDGASGPVPLASPFVVFRVRLLDRLASAIRNCDQYERIVILPHRELGHVPFSELERMVPGCSVSVAPSGMCATLLQRRKRTSQGRVVAFGDATRTLRYVSRELAAVSADHVAMPSIEQLRVHGKDANVLHFAGHGWFDHENPYRSALVGQRSGLAHEARLNAWFPECTAMTLSQLVGELDLPVCRLAVLSACYTGLPRLHPASEFTSLPAALLIAGANNVVASLWPAHDAAAAVLMTLFYAALDSEHSPSRALGHARSGLRTTRRTDALALLGADAELPPGERPFDDAVYLDGFQLYGVD